MPISTIGANGLNRTEDFIIDGLTVGRGGGNVAGNTVVGATPLSANTTGDQQVAIGNRALDVNTSGTENTSVGSASLFSNTTGSYNVAVGRSALRFNTTSSYNTAVGYQAGYSNTTGVITANGGLALYSNTTGTSQVAVGVTALYANTTGSFNTAIGHEALRFNTTRSNHTAVGYQALYSNTGNDTNTAVGYQALYSNTTGGVNVALGSQAGYNNTSANYGTFLGYQAGFAVTTGGSNTFIGDRSGNAITTGSKNSILGSYSGNQGGLDIRTANNYIVLSDGDGNPRIYHDGAALRYFRGLSSSPSFDYVSQSYKTISRSVTTSFLQIDTNSTSSSGLFCNFEIMYLFDDFGQNIYTGRKTYRLYNDSGGTVQLNLVSSEDYGIVPTLSIVRNSTYSVTLRVNTATTASTYGWMYRIRILAYNNATSTQTGQILTFTEV